MTLASGATAQVGGNATWAWDVTTQNGDAVVEPGETATVSLSIDFDPDAGPQGPVLGLGQAVWDTANQSNGDLGAIIEWSVPSNLTELTGDTTTTDGVSLFRSTAAQGGGQFVGFSYDDPIHVLTFEWSPNVLDDYVVTYNTFSQIDNNPENQIIVWEGEDVEHAEFFFWRIDEATITFQVVPAPGVASFLLVGLIATRPRR